LIYLAIATGGARGTIRRSAVIAAISSTIASVAMGGTLIMIEDMFRESREVFRYQAREGFTVVEQGQTIRIERTAQEPLVLTMPKIHELDPMKRVRYALDASVVWLFFRTSLSLDPSADVTLSEEIDLQRLYLDIEKARFPDRLHVEIDVPEELEQARLPALLLQPIVENAIKYGVSKSRKAVVIRIAAKQALDGRMNLEISNRLKHGGKDELPAATHEGTGL